MKATALKDRTRDFAVKTIKLVEKIPKSPTGDTVGGPLLRAGTAVGAACRTAIRSRNRWDFVSRINAAEEAMDETLYWLEIVRSSNLLPDGEINPVVDEAAALKRILVKSRRIAEKHLRDTRNSRPPGVDGEDIPF
ncbi:MAG: four helix bundle protein [Planctomycetes bacterium]|nr:four helix bundle protein [Planctomycetota bacterium]